jgi:hypothetical protein
MFLKHFVNIQNACLDADAIGAAMQAQGSSFIEVYNYYHDVYLPLTRAAKCAEIHLNSFDRKGINAHIHLGVLDKFHYYS